jgi:hypothetical protein
MNLDALDLEPDAGVASPDRGSSLDDVTAHTEIEPDAEPVAAEAVSPALVEVLGADVALPALVKWIPDTRVRDAALGAATVASTIDVGTEAGFLQADRVLADLRACQKAITAHFEEPKAIAFRLHRRISGIESEWLSPGEAALRALGGQLYEEQRRRERAAAEVRRLAQEEADRIAREAAAREADEAAAAAVPAPIVEELQARVQTVRAAPVAPAMPAPKLSGSTTVSTWKARLSATTGDREPNPDVALMNAAERAGVVDLLRWILEAPDTRLVGIEVNWKYWNARAKADKSTLRVPGIEAFEQGSLRGKGGRR